MSMRELTVRTVTIKRRVSSVEWEKAIASEESAEKGSLDAK